MDYSFPMPLESRMTPCRDFHCLTRISNDADVVESLLDAFNGEILAVLNEQAPVAPQIKRRHREPWITHELQTKRRERDRLYKEARRSRCPILLPEFRLLRKQLKIDIREDYFFWHLDGAGISQHSGEMGLLTAKNRDGSPLNTFKTQELMEHYSAITYRHPPCSGEELAAAIETPTLHVAQPFAFRHVDGREVLVTMYACLLKSKGQSCDSISMRYLRDSLHIIMLFFTRICNTVKDTFHYPSAYLRSLIIPLSKKPNPENPSDTRPVANLCHLAKFLDTLLTGKMMNYLESNELLSLLQSGFRARHSTQTALLNLLEDVHFPGEKKKVTVLILFDFTKAFDSLSHRILLAWLREMNCSGDSLRFIHSYLTGRSQAVLDLDGTTTEFMPNTSGIPQGSSPGPVLFLAYINSVVHALNFTSSTWALFAAQRAVRVHSSLRRPPDSFTMADGSMDFLSTMTDLHRVILKCLLRQLERFDDVYSEHRALVQSALADLVKFQELEFPEVVVLGPDCHNEDWDRDTELQ
ncbi:uncharacterized protein LOC106653306 [Trichogramma pretiosum]|uniref:uncharacterized protein LOC106653306 n=1 Tax=Trichogramma pretiosum TaxID=7493 RepID=UPI000C719EB5|nr:uncharacterized protein LOC106653306 [Trichogramma pretiosum]